MRTIALHTRLRAGCEAEYERVHARIPDELDGALRAAGVRSWRIWRSGRELFHLVECEDYGRAQEFLREHPANVPWQQRINALLESDFDAGDSGLGLVWELP